jgi:transposase
MIAIFPKKYFSIAETARLCDLPMHKLRYIEKSDTNIKITKIRGRRYYTEQDIKYIKSTYSAANASKADKSIISQIDQLIGKFSDLIEILETSSW